MNEWWLVMRMTKKTKSQPNNNLKIGMTNDKDRMTLVKSMIFFVLEWEINFHNYIFLLVGEKWKLDHSELCEVHFWSLTHYPNEEKKCSKSRKTAMEDYKWRDWQWLVKQQHLIQTCYVRPNVKCRPLN